MWMMSLGCSLVLVVLGSASAIATDALPRVLNGTTLEWADGRQFVTTLFDAKIVGQLQTTKKQPYLILTGRGCEECDANISIYIHSPSDGPMKGESSQTRYSYPGRVRDYSDGTLEPISKLKELV